MQEVAFSPYKAAESLLYIVKQLAKPTIHEALKIRYFADKLHLSKYGFLASGDNYVAMKFGPVASNTYDMIKAAKGVRNQWIHPEFIKAVEGSICVKDDIHLIPLRDANLSFLAPSDIECLNDVIALYGDIEFSERTDISHDEAWEKAWESASKDSLLAGDMPILDIAKTLDNASEVIEHLKA